MDDLPAFYDDLSLSLRELWHRLAQGAEDRRSPFHTPSLATLGRTGAPRVRVVVLRGVDAAAGDLRLHCDARSDKAGEIAADGRAALLAYDAQAKIQVRVEGRASLHRLDGAAEAAWAEARPMSRLTYAVAPGPGTPLPAGGAYAQAAPPTGGTEGGGTGGGKTGGGKTGGGEGRENFALVVLRAERLDFLYLARRGHRRARWRRDEAGDAGWVGSWLTP